MFSLRDTAIRQLQIFAVAGQHERLARAVEDLHLTQPAVSTQIKQLEGTTGLALFECIGCNSALTGVGKELLQYAENVFSSLKDAEDSLAAIRVVRKREITIATVSTAKYFYTAIGRALLRNSPLGGY